VHVRARKTVVMASPTRPVREFRVNVPDEQLGDLRHRLASTRWPSAATEPGWNQGVPTEWLRELVNYWLNDYDWRTREARFNAHPQVLVEVGSDQEVGALPEVRVLPEVDVLDIHAVHIRSPHPDAVPVILTHGWPGSFAEYLTVAEALAEPTAHGGSADDACHVVLPSLPGYAFSGKPTGRGWGINRIADAWVELMGRLGYERFVAGGSDWGTSVSAALGARHPPAVHALVLIPPLAPGGLDTDHLSTAEKAAVDALAERRREGTAYSELHRTRPQTLGFSLSDSPVGLAAWIAEKFWEWSDHDGDVFSVISRDDLLDTVMLYWLTNSGASSARLYRESVDEVRAIFESGSPEAAPITVPVGAVMFPHEVPRISRRLAERRFPDLRVWEEPGSGGHFGSLENPNAVVAGITRTIRATR
jgi:pimeloyl-ACP methyl ester carboxylesterase